MAHISSPGVRAGLRKQEGGALSGEEPAGRGGGGWSDRGGLSGQRCQATGPPPPPRGLAGQNSRTRQAYQIPGSDLSLSQERWRACTPVPQRDMAMASVPWCWLLRRHLRRPLRCDGWCPRWAGQAQACSPLGSKCPLYAREPLIFLPISAGHEHSLHPWPTLLQGGLPPTPPGTSPVTAVTSFCTESGALFPQL